MDVGVEGPRETPSFLFGFSSQSIGILVELGVDPVFTVYRPQE